MYRLQWVRQSKKDYETGIRFGWYAAKIAEILVVLRRNPFEPTQGHCFERLTNNLKGYCSRQINHGNRILYEVLPNTKGARDKLGNLYEGIVRVLRAWGHNYKAPT